MVIYKHEARDTVIEKKRNVQQLHSSLKNNKAYASRIKASRVYVTYEVSYSISHNNIPRKT